MSRAEFTPVSTGGAVAAAPRLSGGGTIDKLQSSRASANAASAPKLPGLRAVFARTRDGAGGGGHDNESTSLLTSTSGAGALPFGSIAREDALSRKSCHARLAYRLCGNRVSPRQFLLFLTLFVVVLVGSAVGVGGVYGAPTFVAQRIAATTLSFSSLALSDAYAVGPAPGSGQPGGSWGFTLTASAVLSGLEPVGGTLASFEATLRFPAGGPAVATFMMPSLEAAAGAANPVSLAVPVTVSDIASFQAFGRAMVQDASVEASITGVTSVSTRVGPTGPLITVRNVPFVKSFVFGGAAGLPGSNVTAFSLGRSNASTPIVDLTVVMNNPSIVSIVPLGRVSVGVYYEGNRMGSVSAENVTLLPGLTPVSFSGILNPSNLTATDALISAYVGGGSVAVVAQGEPDGGSNPLYAPVISALALSATLNGAAVGAPPLIAGIYVEAMFLTPVGQNAVGVGLTVTVGVTNLLGPASPITVQTVALDCQLYGAGKALGELKVPPTPVPPTGEEGRGAHAWPHAVELLRGRALTLLPPPSPSTAVLRGGAPPLPVFNVTISLSALLAIETGDTSFGDFVLAFLGSSAVDVGLVSSKGPGGVDAPAMTVNLACALGDLSVSIPLNVVTSVPGIDGFPYVAVEVFAVTGESVPGPDGGVSILANLTVAMLNPSPASFPLGANATLGIYARAPGATTLSRLGYSILENKTLEPGLNRFQLVGVVSPDKSDPVAMPAASALFSAYLGGLNASAVVQGEQVTLGPGLVTPAWLQDAVANISLSAVLPGLDPSLVPNLLVDLAALSLDLSFLPQAPDRPIFSGRVRGTLQLPFALEGVTVGGADASMTLLEAGGQYAGSPIGAVNFTGIKATWLPCTSIAACNAVGPQPPPLPPLAKLPPPPAPQTTTAGGVSLIPAGVIILDFPPTQLTVLDTGAFTRLLSSVLRDSLVSLRLVGTASPTVGTPVGNLSITGVGIDSVVSVAGLANLTSPPVVVLAGDITNTSACCLYPSVVLNITNPSPMSASLGPVTLGIVYAWEGREDVPIFVVAEIANFAVAAGPGVVTQITSFGRLYVPSAEEAAAAGYPTNITRAASRDLVARYLNGLGTPVRLLAPPNASAYPLLSPALEGFTASAVFPGISTPLLSRGDLYVDPLAVLGGAKTQPGTITVTNDLSVSIAIANMSVTVYACVNESANGKACYDGPSYGDAIGTLNLVDPSLPRPFAPPHSVTVTERYNITLLGSILDDLGLLIQGTTFGDSVTKINGTLSPVLNAVGVEGSSPFCAEDIFYQQFGVPLYTDNSTAP